MTPRAKTTPEGDLDPMQGEQVRLSVTPQPSVGVNSPFQRLLAWLSEKPVRWLIILVLVVGIFLGTWGRGKLTEEVNRPLGPTLPPFATQTPLSTDMIQDGTAATSAAQSPTPPTLTEPGTTPIATPRPMCGDVTQMIILAIGSDSRYGVAGGLADVIRVVRVDFVTPSISVLTIPRDLWVPIPGLGSYGSGLEAYFGRPLDSDGEEIVQPGDYGRINTAYFYGYLYDLPGGGPGILAWTIYENFHLPVEHYIALDMRALEEAVDAVGGIDIYVPYEIENFSVGQHHMTGEEALAYARIRSTDNDWYRAERQNQVLLALRARTLQPDVLSNLPSLVDEFMDDVLTDLSSAQIASLICLLTKVEREAIISYTISPEMVTPTYTTKGSFVLLPTEEQIRLLITDFLHGKEPPP